MTEQQDNEQQADYGDLIERTTAVLKETGQLTIQRYSDEAQARGPLEEFSVVFMVGDPTVQSWGRGASVEAALDEALKGLGR